MKKDFAAFFNPDDMDHIMAYQIYLQTKQWPDGFLPKGITFSGDWEGLIRDKMVKTFMESAFPSETNEKQICARHIWANGTTIETFLIPENDKLDPSDRIELKITPAKQKPASFYLNVEDATMITHSLSVASLMIMDRRLPVWPEDK